MLWYNLEFLIASHWQGIGLLVKNCRLLKEMQDQSCFVLKGFPSLKLFSFPCFVDIVNLRVLFQGKVFSDSESIQARAEAVMLLKKLDFPVRL